MRFHEISPAASARFVDRFWMLEDSRPKTVQRVVPDGRPELILNLGQPFECLRDGQWVAQPRCFLAGQLEGPLLLRTSGAASILGIRFRPQGAGQLLGIPMQELTGSMTPLGDLPCGPGGLREVSNAGSVAELEAAVLKLEKGAEDRLVDEAVRQLMAPVVDPQGARDVGNLAARLGVSTRQLERRFKARVGLSPKRFARIQRFQSVFQRMGDDGAGWVDLAIACGYYDQAHLVRDFRDFSGAAHSVLLAEGELAEHFLSHSYKTGARHPR
jgi:AraC-like DNA-binding protein